MCKQLEHGQTVKTVISMQHLDIVDTRRWLGKPANFKEEKQ